MAHVKRGWPRLGQFARDVRYGFRQIRRNVAFSAMAIATLALGIGGMAAVFSAFDTVLIRPLPYTASDQLVMIWDDLSKEGIPKHFPAPAEMLEWRRRNTVFSDIAATNPEDATLSGGEPEQVRARRATFNLFSVLGVAPRMGRVFTAEEDDKGVRVLVISHGLWQRRFGGAPDVIGRTLSVNDNPYEVIGVMAQEFFFMPGPEIDLWMPASFPPFMRTNMSWHSAHVVARLKPGTTLQQARASMAALSLEMTAKDNRGPHTVVVNPLREDLAGKTHTTVIVLLAASGALLLIGCVNLANLLMSRGAVRGREVAVRTALGAGRGRLVAQFLTESLVLAAVGAVLGIALAVPAMRLLEAVVPESMGAVRLTLDWRVLGFAAAVTMAAALAFGLMPALRGTSLAPQQGLRDGGRGTAGARSQWLQHALIVTQTAIAVVLLVSGSLLLQTFQHLRSTDLGMRSDRLLTFDTPLFRYPKLEQRVAFVNAELDAIRGLPGVVSVGATSQIPLRVMDAQATFYFLAGQTRDKIRGQVALMRTVTRDYLQTIGATLREGRFFDGTDVLGAQPVAIVNESFVNRNYPGRPAIGERFQYGQLNDKGYWYTIVGVVKEIHEVGMAEDLRPAVYKVHEQADQIGSLPNSLVVRTSVDPASLVPSIRKAIWSVDPNMPIARVRTVDDIFSRELATPTQSTTLVGIFAALALLVASIGLYGVLSYAVTQRTNEIGVRMALGATPSEILWSVSRRGLALTAGGLVIGLALTPVAAKLLTALLYGVQPQYFTAGASVSAVLLVVAALACLIPARRASRVDPVAALRADT